MKNEVNFAGNFSNKRGSVSFSRRILLHGVSSVDVGWVVNLDSVGGIVTGLRT
jgi:hypothetical protein